jgi:hypothetical protein
VTRYNSRGMRSSSWKLKAGAGGLAVVGGIAGGLALTSHSTAIHDSAYDFGFGENGYGAMLNSAMAGLQTHNAGLTQRSLQELSAIKGFGASWNVVNHHQRSTVEFQRGRIVLITHHFLIVRGQGGKLTVWKLAGNTAVQDVAATVTATPAPTVATATPTVATATPTTATPAAAVVTPTPTVPASAAAVPVTAAVPTLTTGTAATAVTGGTPVTTMLNSTAATAPSVTTISVTTGTTTITITITSTPAAATVAPTAKVTTPVTTTTPTTTTAPAAKTTTTVVPTAALTWHGLAAGDLVFVAGTERHHVRTAELVLIEALAPVTPAVTPSATVKPTVTPAATAPVTVTPAPTVSATVTPTPAVIPTTTVSATPTVATTPTNS